MDEKFTINNLLGSTRVSDKVLSDKVIKRHLDIIQKSLASSNNITIIKTTDLDSNSVANISSLFKFDVVSAKAIFFKGHGSINGQTDQILIVAFGNSKVKAGINFNSHKATIVYDANISSAGKLDIQKLEKVFESKLISRLQKLL